MFSYLIKSVVVKVSGFCLCSWIISRLINQFAVHAVVSGSIAKSAEFQYYHILYQKVLRFLYMEP